MALTGERPFYVVEHGSDCYDFDSYGIHLGQDDRLVFLGESCQQIVLKLMGMREGSPTLHMSEEIIFNPSPHVELAIPRGVGHALFNMGMVFTINRPYLFLDPDKDYFPGNDIIDWPIADREFSIFEVNEIPATLDYYSMLIERQRELAKNKVSVSTPRSVMVMDAVTGRQVKVLLRKRITVD